MHHPRHQPHHGGVAGDSVLDAGAQDLNRYGPSVFEDGAVSLRYRGGTDDFAKFDE